MDQTKRDVIYDAAIAEFTKHGFKQASIDEIARRAGVAKGTVYLACSSKEELFFFAVQRELATWQRQLTALVDPTKPAIEVLATASRAGLAFMEAHPLILDLFLRAYHAQLPAWAERFEQLRAGGHERAQEILRLGIAQGRFRADLDVPMTATLLLDMQVSTYVWQRRSGVVISNELMEQRFQAMRALVERGLSA